MEIPSKHTVKTRLLIVSDTHGRESVAHEPADVAIHCGDLTEGSKIHEFIAAINLLKQLPARLKLVIAGNHDFVLDDAAFQEKINEAWRLQSVDLVEIRREYGSPQQIEQLFSDAHEFGIRLLREGIHHFTLENGAYLTIYASPYTPSLGSWADWGFQYPAHQGHDFSIGHDVDIVMTHGPPRGVLDHTQRGQRAGSTDLFEAVARARPRLHCFGHIHAGWGAKLVKWRQNISMKPSHLTDIDNGESHTIAKLSTVNQTRTYKPCYKTSHCVGDANPLRPGDNTLFVNAAVEGSDDLPVQPTWIVDLELANSDEM